MLPGDGALVLVILGSGACGAVLGFVLYRKLQGWVQKKSFGTGACARCGTETYLSECCRCRARVGRCHSVHLLLPDDPNGGKLTPRKCRTLCIPCMTPQERVVLLGEVR